MWRPKKPVRIILVFLAIFLVFLSAFRFYQVKYVKGMSLTNDKQYNVTLTEERVAEVCGNFSSDFNKIYCLNKIHKESIKYDENCSSRAYTYSAEQTLNLGEGCCRDSATFYTHFLKEFNIPYEKKEVPPADPHHVFVIAYIIKEDVRIDNFIERIMYKDYYHLLGYAILDGDGIEVYRFNNGSGNESV